MTKEGGRSSAAAPFSLRHPGYAVVLRGGVRVGGHATVVRVVIAAALLTLVCASAAAASDGGSGTYTSTGQTYDFNLQNSGTTAWQYFILVAASGAQFVGGTTGNEGSAHCVVGQPDGQANEIECGPVSASVIPPDGHLGFVATLSALPECGAPFELTVSSTGTPPFSRVGDATFSGSCTVVPPSGVTPPSAVTPPSLHGVATVGATLTATATAWSGTPTRVTYQWQLCAKTGCAPIKGANRLTLKLTKRTAGHSVRITSVATFASQQVESVSKKVAVRT